MINRVYLTFDEKDLDALLLALNYFNCSETEYPPTNKYVKRCKMLSKKINDRLHPVDELSKTLKN